MAGSGVEIGKNVLILYNDSPAPLAVRSLGVGSSAANALSDWIIPGYYYPPRQSILFTFYVVPSRTQFVLEHKRFYLFTKVK